MTRIDRRALFAKGGAAALLAATGLSLEAAPSHGGVLRLAVPRDDSLSRVARGAVFDTLTEVAPDGTLRGELATAWRSGDNARVWEFDLRTDVRFHDGHLLTSHDVANVMSPLGRVEPTGPLSIRVELDRPDPGLPFLLSADPFAVKRPGEEYAPIAQANGTGCYRVDRAQDDRHFRASRVAGHYKSGLAGWVDSLELIVIPDAGIRAEALRDGFVDVAALPSPSSMRRHSEFRFFPSATDMALAVSPAVGLPNRIGTRAPLDDGRIAERWWMI
ncbi:MAG: ABC transporter substrate-binding protein [Pseudomonadota bacterium]